MPKKRMINVELLLKMVNDGSAQKKIMNKFGFKNSSQLKVAYVNALMESGKIPKIKGGRGAESAIEVNKEIKVNKRGSLVIPKVLIQEFGFKEGETFVARKSKAGISLKMI